MLQFYDQQGRKDLPWQQNKNAYKVWVSEIMLQQTQVKTVIPYYLKFLKSFPTITKLAKAEVDDVLTHWAGLGYYSRARNLHSCANIIMAQHAGKFPKQLEQLTSLPGIGESTAGAILSLTYDLPEAILDGNVKRVLARVFLVDGWYGNAKVSKELWQLSRKYTPTERTGHFNQAMMDLGAGICNRAKPLCNECPLSSHCEAYLQDKTAEYPHRKQKKQTPSKEATMLLIFDNNDHILLEKRPPSGIWGGLWSLPETGDTKPIKDIIGQFKHTFSHYHLHATVVSAKQNSKRVKQIEDDHTLTWHNINELTNIALPTPIKKFLINHLKTSG